MKAPSTRMPVGFVGHGSPTLALDSVKGPELQAWGASLPKASAILVISAHWEDAPITLSATRPVELVYDFYGFPAPLYRIRYDAPPAAELADRIEKMLPASYALRRSDRGLDHGAWVPLLHLAPDATTPVLQLSMPRTYGAEELLRLGALLSPLRDEGVWILGSGNLVHNLRAADFRDREPPPPWAVEFDQWVVERLAKRDIDALADHRGKGPGARLAHPTDDHYRPLLVSIGAAGDDISTLHYPVTGFEYGNISRRCISFG